MNLQPVTGQPGLWFNPAWTPGSAGMFALVIGVSEYSHLREDSNSLHMGKLHVSAQTAYQFFDWLGKRYQMDGIPLATCRLLLAPSAEELAAESGLGTNARAPTFDNCESAILEWFHEMETLPLREAEKSRSVFFFSGHGLEVTEEMQVLLPQDYLRPPVPQYNRAIGTYNLRRGLKGLKVARHFVFLDACRNDHDNLRQQDPLEGARILTQVSGASRNSKCLVPLFFASASGEQAFQPKTPAEGISLFGRALLEGLDATGLDPACDDRRCVVSLDPLLGYCKRRIPEIARVEFGEDLYQEVRLSGDYVQDPVTEVNPASLTGFMPSLEWFLSASSPDFFFAPRAESRENRTARLRVRPAIPPHWRDSFNAAHDLFGSERVTEPFLLTSRVYSYSQRGWLERGRDFTIEGVRFDEARKSYEVELTVTGSSLSDHWFEISDSARRFGMRMPGAWPPPVWVDEPDPGPLRYRLEFEMTADGFNQMGLHLSGHSPEPYARVARVWDAYRNENLTSATEMILSAEASEEMKKVIAEKTEAPLAAAIAGLLLVRGHGWEQLHDWLRNLANWFPDIPDGLALWAEQLLRQHPGSPEYRAEAMRFLLRLEERPLPFLGEVMGMAYSRMLEFADEPDLNARDRSTLTQLIERYRMPVMRARPGGLFTLWAGHPAEIVPEMVLPGPLA